ncbi:A/G-specific adenine glycosylase [Paenibacillus sambharensis]|uniref:Adenine DNA glycosylase n=2 Tax=Paenibacillus sambharensis TaxID=1803190 RepID=A0A2W1LKS2_9BACL|nr:A/G-specific adenine glycosylase [Paenibacillus sambharensis]
MTNKQQAALEQASAGPGLFFGMELLGWYRSVKRDLPWRENRDPYRVWVSEIMLQQTRVDTVIPYYKRFMDKFPTIRHLAEAPEEEVLKCWEGLGYYSRARNLQAGAQQVVSEYGGSVPDDKTAVAALKGVGPYTAGAIMSIAFNRPEPAVDGNVMRVLSRYFCLEDDIAKPSVRTGIERIAAALIPEGAAGDFNQGIMELGALICTPKSPGCLICPVMAECAGRLAGRELELPVKTKAKPPRPELRLAALVEGAGPHAGAILVRQRPESGLLARMWELPHVLAPGGGSAGPVAAGSAAAAGPVRGRRRSTAALDAPAAAGEAAASPGANREARMALMGRALAEEARLLIRPRRWWRDAEHVFSHIRWDLQVYLADFGFVLKDAASAGGTQAGAYTGLAAEQPAAYMAGSGETAEAAQRETAASYDHAGLPLASAALVDRLPEGYRWIRQDDMKEMAFPNVFLRLLNDYWEQRESGCLPDEAEAE